MTKYRNHSIISNLTLWLFIGGWVYPLDAFAATEIGAVDAEVVVPSQSAESKTASESATTNESSAKTETNAEPRVESGSSQSTVKNTLTVDVPAVKQPSSSVVSANAISGPLEGERLQSTSTVQSASVHAKASGESESGYVVSGYVQSQIEFHQDSEDQLRQGGALLNQNRFLVRRGRVRIARDWEWASFVIEFDGNTTKGASARLQKGEASLVYRRSALKSAPPLLQFTAGMFELPFGFEMTESAKTRWFMERSITSRALFPGEPDVGAKLFGGLAFLRYSVAVTNGEPLDERSGFGLQDPNKNKDLSVRLGVDTKVGEAFNVSGGMSYNVGRGFHAGTDATKATLSGQDANGDGIPESVLVKPATAATPSENFSRWALGADLQLVWKSRLGSTLLYGEVIAAQNLDRGLVVADPTVSDINVRELGGYVGFVQELTKHFVVGVRGDYYDPNADFLDDRAGKQVPTSLRVIGLSPLVGFVLPDRGRLLLQWDLQDNRFARDERGVPTRLRNNTVTARLQVNL